MARVLILDDARLRSASKNAAIVAAFPFFAPAASRRRAGCCGGSAQTDWTAVKAGIAGLPDNRITVLKQLLKADRIAVYVSVNGSPERVER